MSAVVPFEFQGTQLRVVDRDGEPWWVLTDVAKTLGYRDAEQAGRLVRDKHKGTHNLSTSGGTQEITIISEGGLYRLVMKSRSPVADEFQDWVTDEVLPAIRKTGLYAFAPSPAVDVDVRAERLAALESRLAALEAWGAASRKSPSAVAGVRGRRFLIALFSGERDLAMAFVCTVAWNVGIDWGVVLSAKADLDIETYHRIRDDGITETRWVLPRRWKPAPWPPKFGPVE